MIVRDEEANLPHCLSSVSGLFDEIVVVDTGSTDRTREIAREFGARVFDFVCVNDFAAAYVVRCSCDSGPNGDGGQTVVDHIRLFQVREGVRWTYAVHEQIFLALASWCARTSGRQPFSEGATIPVCSLPMVAHQLASASEVTSS